MNEFASASATDVQRLLELFPLAALKEQWGQFSGTKEEIAAGIAKKVDREAIAAFAMKNLGRCRQHVHVLAGNNKLKSVGAALPDAEVILTDSTRAILYFATARYVVHLSDPYDKTELELIWPIRVQAEDGNIIANIVTFERNPAQYFDRSVLKVERAVDEKLVTTRLGEIGFEAVDLHKGIKKLWHSGFMDASRVTFKRPKSTSSERMDEEAGIRENDPELYATLRKSQLFSTFFRIDKKAKTGVEHFIADPTLGRLVFSKYTDADGDVDDVVRAILNSNK